MPQFERNTMQMPKKLGRAAHDFYEIMDGLLSSSMVHRQRSGKVFMYDGLVRAECCYTCTCRDAQEIIGTHVRNLRQRLEQQNIKGIFIESIRGIGYRLN